LNQWNTTRVKEKEPYRTAVIPGKSVTVAYESSSGYIYKSL
jgi:hypothetical protein